MRPGNGAWLIVRPDLGVRQGRPRRRTRPSITQRCAARDVENECDGRRLPGRAEPACAGNRDVAWGAAMCDGTVKADGVDALPSDGGHVISDVA